MIGTYHSEHEAEREGDETAVYRCVCVASLGVKAFKGLFDIAAVKVVFGVSLSLSPERAGDACLPHYFAAP